ncbi:aspartyl-phosphate phosphatase Spo0E family protein [Haloimpatiens sp. FM7315]
MEQLREKLYKCIELYGLRDKRTMQISKQLDKLIVKEAQR